MDFRGLTAMLVYECNQQPISRADEASLRAASMVREAESLQRLVQFVIMIASIVLVSWAAG
jgi:hypothetical protein